MMEMNASKGRSIHSFIYFYLISCVVSPDNTDEGSRVLVKLERLPRSAREIKKKKQTSKLEGHILWLQPQYFSS